LDPGSKQRCWSAAAVLPRLRRRGVRLWGVAVLGPQLWMPSPQPKVEKMAKPQTLRVSCVDDGQMSRPVASTSDDNRLNTAETSAEWVAARPSHVMEHVTPFLTAGLAWTNLPRVPPIVGVSHVVCT
jgi:hypothetical protein